MRVGGDVYRLVSITAAHPGTRVVYRDTKGGTWTEPVLLWGQYRQNEGTAPLIEIVYGLTSSADGLNETDASNAVGYLAPNEEMDDDWWSRHGGKPKS